MGTVWLELSTLVKMKALVAGICPEGRAHGPRKKLKGIARALEAEGHTVELVLVGENRTQGVRAIRSAVARFDGDLVILRADYSLPALYPLLQSFRRRGGWVTLDKPTPLSAGLREVRIVQRRGPRDSLALWAIAAASAFSSRASDRIVEYSPDHAAFNVGLRGRTRLIGNAVNPYEFPVAPPPPKSGPVRCIAVASMMETHGYDRLVAGVARQSRHSQEPEIHLTLVGEGNALPKLRRLVEQDKLGDYVSFLPAADGDELTELFAEVDVGIGALAIHRVGMKLASALKNREYLARGVPVLFSGDDIDLDPLVDEHLALKAPLNDDPIDVAQLAAFGRDARKRSVRSRARLVAERKLSFAAKLDDFLPDDQPGSHGNSRRGEWSV